MTVPVSKEHPDAADLLFEKIPIVHTCDTNFSNDNVAFFSEQKLPPTCLELEPPADRSRCHKLLVYSVQNCVLVCLVKDTYEITAEFLDTLSEYFEPQILHLNEVLLKTQQNLDALERKTSSSAVLTPNLTSLPRIVETNSPLRFIYLNNTNFSKKQNLYERLAPPLPALALKMLTKIDEELRLRGRYTYPNGSVKNDVDAEIICKSRSGEYWLVGKRCEHRHVFIMMSSNKSDANSAIDLSDVEENIRKMSKFPHVFFI